MALPPAHGNPVAFGTNAALLGKGVALSRLLGFVRDALIAALLGGGWLTDAFLVAFRLPNAVRRLVADGGLAYTLTPVFGQMRREDVARAARVFRSMTVALVLLFAGASILGVFFPDGAVRLLAPGFTGQGDRLRTAAGFFALCIPYLPLAAGAAVASAALMAEGRFFRPAFGLGSSNLAIIIAAGAGFVLFGIGDVRAARLLCFGLVLGGAIQWAWQMPEAWRAGLPLLGPLAFREEPVTRCLKTLPGTAFGAAGNQGNMLLAAILASFLTEGSVSALYFAERLIELPLGVVGASLSLAALAELVPGTARDTAAFSASLGRAVRFTLFFALPAAVGLGCLAPSITALLFGHGGFDAAALERTQAALVAYTVGLPALAASRPLLAGLGALGNATAPFRAACLGLGLTVLLGVLALTVGAAWGLALAVSLAGWGSGAFLAVALARAGVTPLPGAAWLAKLVGASFVMGIAVALAAASLDGSAARVALGVPAGLVVYFIASRALGLEEAVISLRGLGALLRRKAG